MENEKGLAAKMPMVWEAEVSSSRGPSQQFKELAFMLSDLCWGNNGFPVHQIGPRTIEGKKDNYPNSYYFSFNTEEDAARFRQDSIDLFDKAYSDREHSLPISGIWIRQKRDIGSNLVGPLPSLWRMMDTYVGGSQSPI